MFVKTFGRSRFFVSLLALSLLLAVQWPLPLSANAHQNENEEEGFYHQQNLVSNLAGLAPVTDSHLKNPWGLSRSATSPWWVSDNGTGFSTLYNGAGTPFPPASPLVVTLPAPDGGVSAPTGTVFNSSGGGFAVTLNKKSGSSVFLFATEDGTILGWSPQVSTTQAVIAIDNSPSEAVYKGLAIATTSGGTFIYATNFRAGTVEVYDANFMPVNQPGAFTDPKLPEGYAPFGIQNIEGQILVTYAKQQLPDKEDDQAGPGHGFVDIYSTSGQLVKRLISHGHLNSPWGLALAPGDFGPLSHKLLVGNFGDGRINAYDLSSGQFAGQLRSRPGRPIQIDGLWALSFGNDANAGLHNELFFTAGLNDEADGLFGKLTFVSQEAQEGN